MKRVLPFILAIAAAIIVPASAFAQLAWDGYYRTGGTYYAPATGNVAFEYGDRMRLNVSYAVPDDLFGVKFRLQGNGSSNPGTTMYGIINAFSANPQYGEAYINLFGGVVKVSAGKLDITDYMVSDTKFILDQYLGNIYTDDVKPNTPLLGGQKGNTTGGIVQVKPIDNLSVAVFSDMDQNNWQSNYLGVSAYYAIPSVGKVLFNSQLGHHYGASGYAGSDAYSSDLGESYASLFFSYTGMKNFTATVGVRYDGNTVWNANYNTAVGPAESVIALIDYDMSDMVPMTIGLGTEVDVTNGVGYTEGEINYAFIPQLKLRVYGMWDTTASVEAMNFANVYSNPYIASSATKPNQADNELVGADLVFPVGKAELSAGVVYGNNTNIGIPILVKANF